MADCLCRQVILIGRHCGCVTIKLLERIERWTNKHFVLTALGIDWFWWLRGQEVTQARKRKQTTVSWGFIWSPNSTSENRFSFAIRSTYITMQTQTFNRRLWRKLPYNLWNSVTGPIRAISPLILSYIESWPATKKSESGQKQRFKFVLESMGLVWHKNSADHSFSNWNYTRNWCNFSETDELFSAIKQGTGWKSNSVSLNSFIWPLDNI